MKFTNIHKHSCKGELLAIKVHAYHVKIQLIVIDRAHYTSHSMVSFMSSGMACNPYVIKILKITDLYIHQLHHKWISMPIHYTFIPHAAISATDLLEMLFISCM